MHHDPVNSDERQLAAAAHARAVSCPASLEDWEDRVAERCRQKADTLGIIQSIDVYVRAEKLSESQAIALLQDLETGDGHNLMIDYLRTEDPAWSPGTDV